MSADIVAMLFITTVGVWWVILNTCGDDEGNR